MTTAGLTVSMAVGWGGEGRALIRKYDNWMEVQWQKFVNIQGITGVIMP